MTMNMMTMMMNTMMYLIQSGIWEEWHRRWGYREEHKFQILHWEWRRVRGRDYIESECRSLSRSRSAGRDCDRDRDHVLSHVTKGLIRVLWMPM